jgi:hypothetical protein
VLRLTQRARVYFPTRQCWCSVSIYALPVPLSARSYCNVGCCMRGLHTDERRGGGHAGKAAAACCRYLKLPSACETAHYMLLLLRGGNFLISLTVQLSAGVTLIMMARACVASNFTARLSARQSHVLPTLKQALTELWLLSGTCLATTQSFASRRGQRMRKKLA